MPCRLTGALAISAFASLRKKKHEEDCLIQQLSLFNSRSLTSGSDPLDVNFFFTLMSVAPRTASSISSKLPKKSASNYQPILDAAPVLQCALSIWKHQQILQAFTKTWAFNGIWSPTNKKVAIAQGQYLQFKCLQACFPSPQNNCPLW